MSSFKINNSRADKKCRYRNCTAKNVAPSYEEKGRGNNIKGYERCIKLDMREPLFFHIDCMRLMIDELDNTLNNFNVMSENEAGK